MKTPHPRNNKRNYEEPPAIQRHYNFYKYQYSDRQICWQTTVDRQQHALPISLRPGLWQQQLEMSTLSWVAPYLITGEIGDCYDAVGFSSLMTFNASDGGWVMPGRMVLLAVCCLAAIVALLADDKMGQSRAGEAARQEAGRGENWPQFRGADALGTSDAKGLPVHWSATEHVAWKIDLPGRGWSSPVVWEGKVFLTTVVSAATPPEAKKGLYFGGEQKRAPDAEHEFKVYCLDLATGETVWEKTAYSGKPAQPVHVKNTYASETPVTDGRRLYVCFGNVGIFAYDLGGTQIWTKPLEPRKTRFAWGHAASLALAGDRLLYLNDNEEESYLLALDSASGDEVWRVGRDEKSNWSTPFVWKHEQRSEIVAAGTGRVRSYDLDGKLLWEFAGMSSITIGTPYAYDGLLYISAGYVLDPRKPLYAIRPGASGDISLKGTEASNEFIAWRHPTAAPYNPTTVAYGGRIYVLYDTGLFACYDAKTGKEIYGKQRIPNGRAFTSSPWAYDDKIFCVNEYGETFVFQAGDEFKLLHSNTLAEEDMCMATPAIAGNRLLIRTAQRVYCLTP
jgi:outer membrane protein assembly factor BamB